MTPGRNDPCPCGSGKKYKQCCLVTDEARRVADTPPDPIGEPSYRQSETSFAALLRFARRPEYAASLEAARSLFRGGRPELPLELVEDEQIKLLFFLVFDQRQRDGRAIAERFLAEGARDLTERQRGFVRRLEGVRLRPYEVEGVQVDRGVTLRDLWSGTPCFVTERAGTHQMARWDVLGARVAPEEDGTARFEGRSYLLPTRAKQPLLDALRAEERRLRRRDAEPDEDEIFRRAAPLFHHFWLDHVVFPPEPVIVTTEGEPMEFGTVVYDVADAVALRAALEACPGLERDEDGGYSWFEDVGAASARPRAPARPRSGLSLIDVGPEGFRRSLGRITVAEGRLTLEVTSRARAERGRKLLDAAAGAALRRRSTRFEDVGKALKRHRPRPRSEAAEAIPPEVAAQLLREFKERHYRTWLDEPLPALDGRTPRRAAGLKTQQGRVMDLLKELENHEERGAAEDGGAYDFGWIWAELGLERPT